MVLTSWTDSLRRGVRPAIATFGQLLDRSRRPAAHYHSCSATGRRQRGARAREQALYTLFKADDCTAIPVLTLRSPETQRTPADPGTRPGADDESGAVRPRVCDDVSRSFRGFASAAPSVPSRVTMRPVVVRPHAAFGQISGRRRLAPAAFFDADATDVSTAARHSMTGRDSRQKTATTLTGNPEKVVLRVVSQQSRRTFTDSARIRDRG